MKKRQPKRGRPAKRDGQAKDTLMQVRLSRLESDVFKSTAELCGEELSVWVRRELRAAATRKAKEIERGDPFLPSTEG